MNIESDDLLTERNVKLWLGASYAELVQVSTYPLQDRFIGENDPLVVQEPASVTYEMKETAITFPACRFVWMDLTNGRLVGLRLSPHLQYLELQQAVDLITNIKRDMKQADWTLKNLQVTREVPLADALVEANERMTRIYTWEHDGTEVGLSIKRAWSKGQTLPDMLQTSDLYLLSVSFSNKSIRRQFARG